MFVWFTLHFKCSHDPTLKIDECSEDSYIGSDEFFPGKLLNFVPTQVIFFRGLGFRFLSKFFSFPF